MILLSLKKIEEGHKIMKLLYVAALMTVAGMVQADQHDEK